jgi:hypothetical protein
MQADEEVQEDEMYLGAATLAKLRSGDYEFEEDEDLDDHDDEDEDEESED